MKLMATGAETGTIAVVFNIDCALFILMATGQSGGQECAFGFGVGGFSGRINGQRKSSRISRQCGDQRQKTDSFHFQVLLFAFLNSHPGDKISVRRTLVGGRLLTAQTALTINFDQSTIAGLDSPDVRERYFMR